MIYQIIVKDLEENKTLADIKTDIFSVLVQEKKGFGSHAGANTNAEMFLNFCKAHREQGKDLFKQAVEQLAIELDFDEEDEEQSE